MVLMLIGTTIWFIPPMTARFFYTATVESMKIAKPAESAFAVVCMNILPPGMIGLMVVAMFAASMSSMDTGLNKNAAIFINNIYPALSRIFNWKERSGKQMLFFSQMFSALFGVCGIMTAVAFAAVQGMGQFELVLLVGALLGTPMAVPMFWGLIVKKVPSWSALFSIGGGLAVSTVAYFSKELFGRKWVYQEQILYVFLAGSICYFLTVLFANRSSSEYKQRVEGFFKDMNTPVDFEKEVGKANDLSQLKVIGLFTFLIGVFICSLMFIADSALGIICPLVVGGIIVAIGLIMTFVGFKHKVKRLEDEKGVIYDKEEYSYE
jgi:Na+/proline symporter